MRYNNQELKFELDLVSKGLISISAMGMEIQSKKSIQSLNMLYNNLYKDIHKIQKFHQEELEKMNKMDKNKNKSMLSQSYRMKHSEMHNTMSNKNQSQFSCCVFQV